MKKKNMVYSILGLMIISILVTYTTYKLQLPDIELIIGLWKINPLSFILNLIPIFILFLLIFSLTGRLSISLVLGSLIPILIAYANAQKIIHRSEPIVLSDITIIKEAINMVLTEGFGLSKKLLLYVVIFIILSIILILYLKNFKINIKQRAFLMIIVLVSSVGLFKTVYSSSEIYNSLPRLQEEETNIAQSYNDKGVIYCLIYNRDTHKINKPSNFNSKYIEDIKKDFEYEEAKSKPHVVMIMGEAWTDLSENPNLEFKENMDPMRYAKEIMKESLVSGHIIAPSYGGGTANTEYDSITGNSTLLHNEGVFTSYSAVRDKRKSITQVFNNNGYSTIGIHPGLDWFYNRNNVYHHFGFDEIYFSKDFINPEMKGGYISEGETTKFFLEKFDKALKSGNPVFEFGVNIQNHSPFSLDKYGYVEDSFTSKIDLDKEDKEILESYFIGMRDMDIQIKEMTDYFNSIDEPILFVYYGDHQPYLNADFNMLIKLGIFDGEETAEKIEPIYTTPFFIWANDNLKNNMDIDNLELDTKISANFLGSMALEAIGLEKTDYFYSYLSDLRKEMPVIFRFFYYTNDDGEINFKKYQELNDSQLEALAKYNSINYSITRVSD